MKFVREQFSLAAATQNIKRLVRFLGQSIPLLTEFTPSRVKKENSQQGPHPKPPLSQTFSTATPDFVHHPIPIV
jgi:hypothetical protein